MQRAQYPAACGPAVFAIGIEPMKVVTKLKLHTSSVNDYGLHPTSFATDEFHDMQKG
jgi:hypothetical protein